MKRSLVILFALCLLLSLAGCGAPAQEVEMLVYLEADLSDLEQQHIGTKLNTMPDVITVEYVSNEERLEDFLSHQEDSSTFDGVDASYISSMYVISANTKDVKALAAEIEAIDGIDEVSYFPQ